MKIDSDGMLFRLNGNGLWKQITNVELYELVQDVDWIHVIHKLEKR